MRYGLQEAPNFVACQRLSNCLKQDRGIADIDIVAPGTQFHGEQLFDRWLENPDANGLE